MHAIARENSSSKVYCQLSDISHEEETEEDDYMRELNLIPSSSSSGEFFTNGIIVVPGMDKPQLVEAIFEALSACAALHPDPQAADEEDSDGAFVDANEDTYGNGFETFTGNDEEELSEVGRVRSNLLNDNRYAPY